MSPHSRLESLPTKLLSRILTWCDREDLVNLAQTRSSLHVVCREELINYPLIMKVTPDSIKSWVAYFHKENTLLTQGARSLDMDITMTIQALLDSVKNADPTVVDANARPIHPDPSQILSPPSSLRKLSLKIGWMLYQDISSEFLLFLLLRSLPEQCPHLEDLTIQACTEHPSDEFDKCIRRLTHLKKLRLHVWSLPNIPNRLSLLPASLTDLSLCTKEILPQEEVATTVTWVHEVRNFELWTCPPQGIANVLMILSRGGATHLTELILKEDKDRVDPAAMISLRKALTVGLQEFSILQPPLRTLKLLGPSAWSGSIHLPLLHTAVVSTLTQLSLERVNSCIFSSHLSWPHLQSLSLRSILKMGYEGPLTEPIFPVLTTIAMHGIREIQAPKDLFPALETIAWLDRVTPEQVASLVRHDIKRIYMAVNYTDDLCKTLWEAMGGHTIDSIILEGSLSEWRGPSANYSERIFPEFPNIREFIIEWI